MAHPISATVKQHAGAETPEGVPVVGDVIAEKYRVEQVLGMGGMGVVLAVRHLSLGELYAMKFLLPKVAHDGEAVARFMREARAAVRIKSEHIARVSDVGQMPGGSPYIVMEYLQGTDLGDLIAGTTTPDISTACDFVIQACAGLAEAHQLGIVHRDLKPSNLFLTQRPDGSSLVKVLDFGISKAAPDAGQPTITATQEVFGSPAYMSPEQIRSAKNVDARSDVWSLGVILYELIAKRLPFDGETSAGLLAAISADEPKSLSSFRSDAGPDLDQIIHRCLQKKPDQRFASVAELATALAPLAGPESQSLVARIVRVASPSNIPPPMTSVNPPPLSAPRVAELAATERSWTTGAPTTGGRSPIKLIALAALALGAVGIVIVGVMSVLGARTRAAAPPVPIVATSADAPPILGVNQPARPAVPPIAGSAAPLAIASAPSSSATSASLATGVGSATSGITGASKTPAGVTGKRGAKGGNGSSGGTQRDPLGSRATPSATPAPVVTAPSTYGDPTETSH